MAQININPRLSPNKNFNYEVEKDKTSRKSMGTIELCLDNDSDSDGDLPSIGSPTAMEDLTSVPASLRADPSSKVTSGTTLHGCLLAWAQKDSIGKV